jgi:ABC-type Fe3+ transport system permease subunit
MVNHQNNYVSVVLSENDPAAVAVMTAGNNERCPSPSSQQKPQAAQQPPPAAGAAGQQPRRRICWWFLLLLLIVTVACLAFVAVSLVSLLRNSGQGTYLNLQIFKTCALPTLSREGDRNSVVCTLLVMES